MESIIYIRLSNSLAIPDFLKTQNKLLLMLINLIILVFKVKVGSNLEFYILGVFNEEVLEGFRMGVPGNIHSIQIQRTLWNCLP